MDLTLGGRAAKFQALLAACEFTDAAGVRLAPEDGVLRAMRILRTAREQGGSVYLVGNGGSAGVASHAATDFVNVAQLRAQTIHDPSILTCMANDYGYENSFARILGRLARADDVLIAISSSGKSLNIRNAADAVKHSDGQVMTLSGFDRGNPLRQQGQLNIWLDSSDYGMVEIGHQFILHNISDRFGREGKVA